MYMNCGRYPFLHPVVVLVQGMTEDPGSLPEIKVKYKSLKFINEKFFN